MGIVPLVADGGEFAHWDLYVRGIANGTDPGHPEYWGPLTGPDQRMVEMAAIGFALLLTPDHVWESLDPAQRRNLATWLGAVDSHEPHPNNWQFFRVLVNLGLAHVGVEYDEEAQKRSLDRIDDFHVGDGWYRDGWYRDGVLGSHDHYVAFALHFYGLLYAARGPEPERERSIRFRDRARLFAPQYARWFDRHGRSVPYGHRSLTYRFTHASFWGALAVAGEEALPWGQVKGLYLRHLRSWRDRPIADRSGVLTVGYGYESQLLSEEYNSPGSPYWAMKAFVPLMLPDDHPFWAAEEEEEEGVFPDRSPSCQAVPGFVLSEDEDQVLLLNGSSGPTWFRQGAAKYAKLAYSSLFGFSVESDNRWDGQLAADSMLTFREPGGALRVREQVRETQVSPAGVVRSTWSVWPDVEIETAMWAAAPWHYRVHTIRTGRYVETRETGPSRCSLDSKLRSSTKSAWSASRSPSRSSIPRLWPSSRASGRLGSSPTPRSCSATGAARVSTLSR